MGPGQSEQPERVVRWYTRAKRIPFIISETPQGERLPGGPYTAWQLGFGVATLVACLVFFGPMSAALGGIGAMVMTLILSAGAAILAGNIPADTRLPVGIVVGAGRSTWSTVQRRTARPPRPKTRHHRAVTLYPQLPPTAPPPAPAASAVVAHVAPAVARRDGAARGVRRALAPVGRGGAGLGDLNAIQQQLAAPVRERA